MKWKSSVRGDKISLNSDWLQSLTVIDFLESLFQQISMLLFSGMLANREFKSKIPIEKSGWWSNISLEKWNEFFIVNFLIVTGFKNDAKNV